MAKTALVQVDIAPLYTGPSELCELADEALYGMAVELLEEAGNGFYRVNTHYHYEGYVPAECLFMADTATVQKWQQADKLVVTAPYLDVMLYPAVQAGKIVSAPRGALLVSKAEPQDGWQKVTLVNGAAGFVRAAHVRAQTTQIEEESVLREKIAQTALSYLGTQYRWGGKTALGIDCSGLSAMAYMMHGVLIYRDAAIKEGFPLREIPFAQAQKGDLLFFPGHVAVYLDEQKFIHSTGRAGDDGVVINSLDPKAPDYREDLAKGITAVGSLF